MGGNWARLLKFGEPIRGYLSSKRNLLGEEGLRALLLGGGLMLELWIVEGVLLLMGDLLPRLRSGT